MITAEDISFTYEGSFALQGLGVVARPGETVGLIGPNGSGKTTLLRILYGSLRPETGSVAIDEVAMDRLSPQQVARSLAVVVQEAAGDLPFTVADLVLLGRTPHLRSFQRMSTADHQIAAECLERVGVRDLARRVFGGLSGGEKQRVLIAKALAQRATHLLLDEPTNHLDIRYQHEVLGLVRGLETTSIVVLHDLNLAARYCDSLVLLDHGRAVAAGAPADVLRSEILEPVYRIGVRRLELDGGVQLLFGPQEKSVWARSGVA